MQNQIESIYCGHCGCRNGVSWQSKIKEISCKQCGEKVVKEGQKVIKTNQGKGLCLKCKQVFGISDETPIEKITCLVCP